MLNLSKRLKYICPLCGRKGTDDHKFCSECSQMPLDANEAPGAIKVLIYDSNNGVKFGRHIRPMRWLLVLGFIMLILAGAYWGWNIINQINHS